ncbi:MAG: AraC family transcriptional regulator [Bacteroides sp.]|nr:AraC family transcriptional regulator [Bacteroides sp.]
MNWVKIIEDAICYIEEHITEDLTVSRIAKEVNISAFYFQRGFSVLCGYTVGEYIRMRRLSLAGNELLSSDSKVIDLAMKYAYDSPDSFTKAFIRFHGSSPTDVRRNGAILKAFAPLHIKLSLDGGSIMEYRIEEKAAFQVMGSVAGIFV